MRGSGKGRGCARPLPGRSWGQVGDSSGTTWSMTGTWVGSRRCLMHSAGGCAACMPHACSSDDTRTAGTPACSSRHAAAVDFREAQTVAPSCYQEAQACARRAPPQQSEYSTTVRLLVQQLVGDMEQRMKASTCTHTCTLHQHTPLLYRPQQRQDAAGVIAGAMPFGAGLVGRDQSINYVSS